MLTIKREPHNQNPAMVRNPIEIALETDNYLVAVEGRPAIISVHFEDIAFMVNTMQFSVECNGTVTNFEITDTITNENQILRRIDFVAGIGGDYLYAQHIKAIMNAHSYIGTKFQGNYVYSGSTPDYSEIEFTSVTHEPATLVFTRISGGYEMVNNIIQEGILDEADNRATEIKLGLYLSVAGDPADGDIFLMQLDDVNYTFIFKTAPDSSGYQLPLRGALSLTDYQDFLLRFLSGAPCFLDKWTVTTTIYLTHIHFIFTSIGYHEGSIITTTEPTRYIFVNRPGYEAVYQPNFTTNVRLICEKNYNTADFEKLADLYSFPKNEIDGDTNHFVSRFKLDKLLYDFMNKTYSENLSAALPFSANFPEALHLLKKFFFQYHESYGTPATNKLIQKSIEYKAALYGAGHLAFTTRKELSPFGLLHPSPLADNAITVKQYADKDQPAWVYFYVNPNDGNDIDGVDRVYYKAYFDDGTDVEADIADAALFAVIANNCKTFFVEAGYKQLNLESLNTTEKSVYKWEVIVDIDGDYLMIKTFVLDCCTAYKSFLMYQNSNGGYDTVVISAPKELSLELSEGKEVERILPTDYVKHNSQFESTIPTARQNIKANIGFKKAIDFDVLKDLLISKFVFLLPKETTDVFIPVNIDRKSVQLESEDDYEKNFTFEFSPAHEFKNFENNLWLK